MLLPEATEVRYRAPLSGTVPFTQIEMCRPCGGAKFQATSDHLTALLSPHA